MRYAALLLLLTACGMAGEVLGTADEKQLEVWWSWSERCEIHGGAHIDYRTANSDTINIVPTHERCDITLEEAVLEGLREHGPTYHPIWVMEEDLWFSTVDAVNTLNAENPGAYPEPEAKW